MAATTWDPVAYERRETIGRYRQTLHFNDVKPEPGDVEALVEWAMANRVRSGAALSAYLAGDTLTEAITAANEIDYRHFRLYLDHRRAGLSHRDAYDTAVTTHVCEYKIEVADHRNPILGTGRVITTRSCSCGRSYTDTVVHNWSGD